MAKGGSQAEDERRAVAAHPPDGQLEDLSQSVVQHVGLQVKHTRRQDTDFKTSIEARSVPTVPWTRSGQRFPQTELSGTSP